MSHHSITDGMSAALTIDPDQYLRYQDRGTTSEHDKQNDQPGVHVVALKDCRPRTLFTTEEADSTLDDENESSHLAVQIVWLAKITVGGDKNWSHMFAKMS